LTLAESGQLEQGIAIAIDVVEMQHEAVDEIRALAWVIAGQVLIEASIDHARAGHALDQLLSKMRSLTLPITVSTQTEFALVEIMNACRDYLERDGGSDSVVAALKSMYVLGREARVESRALLACLRAAVERDDSELIAEVARVRDAYGDKSSRPETLPLAVRSWREINALMESVVDPQRAVGQLRAAARGWSDCGRHLDALRARMLGLLVKSRSADSRLGSEDIAGVVQLAHDLGSMREVRVIARMMGARTETHHAQLSAHPALAQLGEVEVLQLTAQARTRSVPRGESLRSEYRSEAAVVLVLSGYLFVGRDDGDTVKTSAVLGPGDAYEEVEGAQLVARSDAVLALIPAAALRGAARGPISSPPQLDVASVRNTVEERCARLLLELDRRFGTDSLVPGARSVRVPLTKGEIGDLIGASRKAVSLAFSEWARQGLVESDRKRIVLNNPAALVQLAQ
jgi:CRP-like cAMP-binding protein